MSTVTLAVTDSLRAGAVVAYTATGASPLLNVTDSFTFQNTGREIVLVQKTGANPCTVTFDTPTTVDGLAVGQRTGTVLAGSGDAIATTTFMSFGPFPPSIYNAEGSTLLSGMTFSEVTGMNCRIIRLP